MLQNTVKSVPHLRSLPIPNQRHLLPSGFQSELDQIAAEALALLKIDSPESFESSIIADGELALLDWDKRNPDKQIIIQVLDSDTKKLTPEFANYLERVLKIYPQR